MVYERVENKNGKEDEMDASEEERSKEVTSHLLKREVIQTAKHMIMFRGHIKMGTPIVLRRCRVSQID